LIAVYLQSILTYSTNSWYFFRQLFRMEQRRQFTIAVANPLQVMP